MNPDKIGGELTPREREVLDLAGKGYTNNEIAARLGITKNAVRFHLKEVHSKLETGSERSVLTRRWRGLAGWAGIPVAKLGLPVTVTAFAGVMAVGSFAAYQALPRSGGGPVTQVPVVNGRYPNGCPTEFNAGTMTLEDFARGSTTLTELRALNPDLPMGYLAPETIVKVPYDPMGECRELVPTPPARR